VNINPFNKRNPKNASPRSDSSLKPRQIQEKHRPEQHTTQHHIEGGGGVMRLPVKNTPNQKRNPKTAPPRSDSAQKRAPKQHIPTQLHRGEGGVMHRSLKNPPPHERSRKTLPIRPRSYQKGHLFIPKTAILSQPFKNPYDHLPVTTMEPRAGVEPAANSLQGCRSTTELPRRNNMKDPMPHIFFPPPTNHTPMRV
jgi:hypothetical protein